MSNILTEEELKKIVIKTHNRVILHDDLDMVIKSHHQLLQANAELSFKKEIFKRAVEDIIVAVDFTDAETVRALAFKALEEAK